MSLRRAVVVDDDVDDDDDGVVCELAVEVENIQIDVDVGKLRIVSERARERKKE
jgi:hypothetical protein